VRRRILDAARELFAAEGYEAVTMRKVAECIEYTPPAIYFHFKDKLELIQALVQEDFATLAGRFARLGEVSDPWGRLAQMGRDYVAFAIENPNHYRLLFMTKLPPEVEKMDDPARGIPAQDAYAMVHLLSSEAIAAGCLKPEYQDPDLVAQVLWSGMHGIASLAITMCDSHWISLRPTPVLTDAMIDALLAGMGAPATIEKNLHVKPKPPKRKRTPRS
jgi:AcrR family transcriptional regulator